MIPYDPSNPWSTLCWARGSIIPVSLFPSLLCALTAVMGVYVNDQFAVSVDSTSHNILGTSLGFLLVFRSTLANQRFWDGRTHLGEIVSSIRMLLVQTRSLNVYLDKEYVPFSTDVSRYVISMYYLVVMQLRRCPAIPNGSRLPEYFTRGEMEQISAAKGPFMRVLLVVTWLECRVTQLARKGLISAQQEATFSRYATDLVKGVHGADKIRGTPIPFPYYQLCNFLMLFFAMTVPLVIANYNNSYATAPIFSFMVALGFFGMNRMGNELQDPFGLDANDLPMEQVGSVVELDAHGLFPHFAKHYSQIKLWYPGHFIEDLPAPVLKPKSVTLKAAATTVKAVIAAQPSRSSKMNDLGSVNTTEESLSTSGEGKESTHDEASVVAAKTTPKSPVEVEDSRKWSLQGAAVQLTTPVTAKVEVHTDVKRQTVELPVKSAAARSRVSPALFGVNSPLRPRSPFNGATGNNSARRVGQSYTELRARLSNTLPGIPRHDSEPVSLPGSANERRP